ncbi:MAG: DNA polymerase IV [Acidobacteria bacterium]|nr:DNA polymerase IV [Acidobacteriota bacterium]
MHLDMDAFFVSVEELFDPSLKGQPVVVGGAANQRGVVSAASYAARKFGIHSAMPLRTAYQLCPHAIFVDGHRERYTEYSHRVAEVLGRFSPKVEMASIDEAYLDLTGSRRLFGPPLEAAHKLHQAVKAATGLNCSIGVSQARMVSKVASDQAKPNGVLWICPGEEASFLAPLDIRRIPGVGKAGEQRLNECGIHKVGDLARLDAALLEQKFGKWGLALAGKSHGFDSGAWFDGEIGDHDSPKSISHEMTFHVDTADRETLEATLARLSEMVGRRLREHSLFARTIQLKLRYSDFSTYTRAHSIDHGTQLDIELLEEIRGLFRKAWDGRPVRLLGVHAGSLKQDQGQLNLLDEGRAERWRKALSAADRMRDKFGDRSVSIGAVMKRRPPKDQ